MLANPFTGNLITFIMCLIIFVLGCFIFFKDRVGHIFYIGMAFGLFGVTHLISLYGLESEFAVTMLLMRVFAYLLVLFALITGRDRCSEKK